MSLIIKQWLFNLKKIQMSKFQTGRTFEVVSKINQIADIVIVSTYCWYLQIIKTSKIRDISNIILDLRWS